MFEAIFNILGCLNLWDFYHMLILVWQVPNFGYGYETQDIHPKLLFATFMVIYFTYLIFSETQYTNWQHKIQYKLIM